MDTLKLKVSGMSCAHCANAISKALGAMPGIHSVNVDLEQKTVTVERDSALAALEQIVSEIEDLGYGVSE